MLFRSLFNENGGGFFRIDTLDDFACATVERQQDGAVWIKELITHDGGGINDIVSVIAKLFPSHEYIVRTPAKNNTGRRFGMLVAYDMDNDDAFPWYGLAFD